MTWLKGYVENVTFDQNCMVVETSVQTMLSGDDGSVMICPNPVANGSFSVKGIENIRQVRVLNLLGKQVAEFDNLNQPSPDIRINVKPGVYVIQCFDGQRFYFSKILVE
ncbi:MAG TPA: T9SS type A sorting domain-containing protein [Bacteroidales bacterium]|nr:T9SS type A sorting domain-containing protein [Bacteroidales bacterium]